MARKNRDIHPSLMGPGPEHGSVFPQDDDLPLDATNAELGEDDDEDDNEVRQPTEMELMRRELDALKQTNAALLRQVPPKEPARVDPPEEETDWENLLFTDPKTAVKKIKEEARKEIETSMRREYTNDQSTNKFWTDFYSAHPDLKGDDDIVELVLNSNLGKLADVPVPEAMTQLADLTRQRIMRLSGGKGKPRSGRAVAEGSSSPSTRKSAGDNQPARPRTLGDIIRSRKDGRRRAATAA